MLKVSQSDKKYLIVWNYFSDDKLQKVIQNLIWNVTFHRISYFLKVRFDFDTIFFPTFFLPNESRVSVVEVGPISMPTTDDATNNALQQLISRDEDDEESKQLVETFVRIFEYYFFLIMRLV